MALGHPPHACPLFPFPLFLRLRRRLFLSRRPTRYSVAGRIRSSSPWDAEPMERLSSSRGMPAQNDVSVMDLQKALTGNPVVEVAPRVPVQAGPFGIKASPDGRLIAVTAREKGRRHFEGNTISIIDVELARMGSPSAEVARVRVRDGHSAGQTRPFTLAWTPDGRKIIVANYRSNNVSIRPPLPSRPCP